MSFGQKVVKVLLIIAKYIWIPILFAIALTVGLYLGYGFITKTSGSNIFDKETWKVFFEQIEALRTPQ